eukprot:3968634-Pyramimonas_sp.AAC.1
MPARGGAGGTTPPRAARTSRTSRGGGGALLGDEDGFWAKRIGAPMAPSASRARGVAAAALPQPQKLGHMPLTFIKTSRRAE